MISDADCMLICGNSLSSTKAFEGYCVKCLLMFLKVVTCGNVPLESSFQKVPRCIYTSTSLYEYRGWGSKAANPTHRRFTWGLRSLEVSNLKSDMVILIYSLSSEKRIRRCFLSYFGQVLLVISFLF